MPLDAFRIFKGPGDKNNEDPIQRRRAQVRKAQRTYQERKNVYAKSLEDALARSKAREAVLTQDNGRLREILSALAARVPEPLNHEIQAELAVLPSLSHAPRTGSISGAGSITSSTNGPRHTRGTPSRDKQLPAVPGQQRHQQQASAADFNFNSMSGLNPHPNPGSTLELSPSAFSDGMLDLSSSGFLSSPYESSVSHVSYNSPSPSSTTAATVALMIPEREYSHDESLPMFSLQRCSVDTRLGSSALGTYAETSIGMEFVLFLERPCLGHIHGDATTPHLSNGHALTLSSQILVISDNANTTPPPDPLGISQTLSKAILNNLLTLAPQVNQSTTSPSGTITEYTEHDNTEREVTPIQAWDFIRKQDQFKRIQVHRLKELLERLGAVAKCYGFGATFPVRDFQRALTECIGYGFSAGL